ncbi:MAG TPA: FAD-binding oxidoreductase [Candidatus Limnocylindrales bacterium]|nr:FAD-binding oxidoreductase [Candidatus Limnocylindrales bacterium]
MLSPSRLEVLSASGSTVLSPDDPGYDAARRSFNGLVDRRPAVIVQPADTAGVAVAVRIAAEAGLPIAVRGGGHSVAGHSMADDALAIDLRRMRRVIVDPVERTSRVEGGATWLDADTASVAHGLASTGGVYTDTGVAGLTLGGGIGYLMGSCGLACDNLIGAEVVTADGSVVRVDPDHDPELLWALRGGGGNFGVVTTFEMALHEIGPLYGGRIKFEPTAGREVVAALLALMDEAPPELVAIPVISGGTGVVDVGVCYRGPADAAERLLADIRRFPIAEDLARPCSYPDVQAAEELMEFGLRHWWKSHFVREIEATALEPVLDAFLAGELRGELMIEAITGIARQEPPGGAAFAQRDARYNVSAIAVWEDSAEDDAMIAWARETAARFEPASLNGGGYINYDVEVTADRVRTAYGPQRYERLSRLKARVDPDNRFRFNHNIEPARI